MEGFMESVERLSGYSDGLHVIESINKIDENGHGYVDFSNYSTCYKFSNENLIGYYDKFNIKNGRVLTVCGSGDQVLSSILYGAKEIDCFDSNSTAYYNMMLKYYGIKYLDYSDFIDFFGISSKDVDIKKIYDSFKHRIDNKNIRVFFDLLIEEKLSISCLYNNDTENMENLFYNVPYLIPENYYKLKNIIDNAKINFKQSDLFNVFENFDGKYNFVNFSNIYDYVSNSLRFCIFIDKAKSHLEDDGAIMINYSWSKPHFSNSINETAEFIGAYQTSIPSCNYNCKDNLNSIMYFGNIKR